MFIKIYFIFQYQGTLYNIYKAVFMSSWPWKYMACYCFLLLKNRLGIIFLQLETFFYEKKCEKLISAMNNGFSGTINFHNHGHCNLYDNLRNTEKIKYFKDILKDILIFPMKHDLHHPQTSQKFYWYIKNRSGFLKKN